MRTPWHAILKAVGKFVGSLIVWQKARRENQAEPRGGGRIHANLIA